MLFFDFHDLESVRLRLHSTLLVGLWLNDFLPLLTTKELGEGRGEGFPLSSIKKFDGRVRPSATTSNHHILPPVAQFSLPLFQL